MILALIGAVTLFPNLHTSHSSKKIWGALHPRGKPSWFYARINHRRLFSSGMRLSNELIAIDIHEDSKGRRASLWSGVLVRKSHPSSLLSIQLRTLNSRGKPSTYLRDRIEAISVVRIEEAVFSESILISPETSVFSKNFSRSLSDSFDKNPWIFLIALFGSAPSFLNVSARTILVAVVQKG